MQEKKFGGGVARKVEEEEKEEEEEYRMVLVMHSPAMCVAPATLLSFCCFVEALSGPVHTSSSSPLGSAVFRLPRACINR